MHLSVRLLFLRSFADAVLLQLGSMSGADVRCVTEALQRLSKQPDEAKLPLPWLEAVTVHLHRQLDNTISPSDVYQALSALSALGLKTKTLSAEKYAPLAAPAPAKPTRPPAAGSKTAAGKDKPSQTVQLTTAAAAAADDDNTAVALDASQSTSVGNEGRSDAQTANEASADSSDASNALPDASTASAETGTEQAATLAAASDAAAGASGEQTQQPQEASATDASGPMQPQDFAAAGAVASERPAVMNRMVQKAIKQAQRHEAEVEAARVDAPTALAVIVRFLGQRLVNLEDREFVQLLPVLQDVGYTPSASWSDAYVKQVRQPSYM